MSLKEALEGLMVLERGVSTIPKTEAVYVGRGYMNKGKYNVQQEDEEGNAIEVTHICPGGYILHLIDCQYSAGFSAHIRWAFQDAQGLDSEPDDYVGVSYLQSDRYFKKSIKAEEFARLSYSGAREWLEANKGYRMPRIQYGRKYAERVVKALFSDELKFDEKNFSDLETLFDKLGEVFESKKSQQNEHPDWCYRQIKWQLNLPIQLIGLDLSKVKKKHLDDRGDCCSWTTLDLKRTREGIITVGYKK